MALVPLLEPDAPDATVPPSPEEREAVFLKLAVALTYATNGTWEKRCDGGSQ